MTADDFSLDAYLARIGYVGPRVPTLAVLRALIARHTATIPFENIDVFTGRGVALDAATLRHKLLEGGRGGYCFEHNVLLRDALAALGFSVTGLMARVVRGQPDDAVTPRTHMMLRVDLPEGCHLADVGFGNLTPTAPLLWSPGLAQQTALEQYRLLAVGEEWLLQAWLADAWTNVYRFPPQPQFQIDYEVANWFTSTRPGGLFVENLVLARPGDRRRTTLFNHRLTLRHLDGSVDRWDLHTPAEYRAALADHFGLALAEADLAAMMQRLALQSPDGAAHPYFA